jgi:hypothetical protein
MNDYQPISTKGMSNEQLDAIEVQAIELYKRMYASDTTAGHLSLALVSLLQAIADECQVQGNIRIMAMPDIKPIIKGYLSNHTLSQAFPYKNGQLLDYVEHSDLYRLVHTYFLS